VLSVDYFQFLYWYQSTIYSFCTDISRIFSVSELYISRLFIVSVLSVDYFQFRCWNQLTTLSLCADIIRLFAVCVLISVECLQSVLILVDYLSLYPDISRLFTASVLISATLHSFYADISILFSFCADINRLFTVYVLVSRKYMRPGHHSQIMCRNMAIICELCPSAQLRNLGWVRVR
jgi:hypothetical protein